MGSRAWLTAVLLLAAAVGFHGKIEIIFLASFLTHIVECFKN